MQLHPAPFEMIKDGKKTIELRLYDEKRRKIRVGDTILFTNTATGEMLDVNVLKLSVFDSFEKKGEVLEINKFGDKKLTQLIKPNYTHFNHRNNDGHIKLGIMNLAQQNLYMLKRLTEKKSEYSVKKLEEDYKKIQNYKKIMCNFPCINFKPKRGFSSDNKYNIIDKKEMKEYFPTINYLNDGFRHRHAYIRTV